MRPDIDKKAPVGAAIFPANDGLLSNDQTYGGEIACLTRATSRHQAADHDISHSKRLDAVDRDKVQPGLPIHWVCRPS
jgi:hypothetical protein